MDLAGEIIIGIWTFVATMLFVVGVIIAEDGDGDGVKMCLVSVIMLIPALIHYFN